MDNHSYHFRKKPRVKRRWRWAVLAFTLLILAIGGAFAYDIHRGQSRPQTGQVQTSQLTFADRTPKHKVDEPTFTLALPGDWKEIARVKNEREQSITWQATKAKEDNRFMTLYIDRLPADKAVNHLLPVEAMNESLRHGEVSQNCSSFTPGGTFDEAKATKLAEAKAQWEDVDFLCDLPRPSENEVGTSSKDGINIVTVSGPTAGKHRYFFLYTDHNIHENFEIFTDIVSSFKAK